MSRYALMTYDEWEELHEVRILEKRRSRLKRLAQKLAGAALVLIGLAALFIDGGVGATVVLSAMGLAVMLSKGDIFRVKSESKE